MKFAIGDDVGQVKVVTTTRGIDTSVQTSARAKIVSFLGPNRNASIQAMHVLRFGGRDGIIAVASKGGLIRFLDPTVSPLAPEEEQVLHKHQLPVAADAEFIGFDHTPSGTLFAATSTGHIELLTQFSEASSTPVVISHTFNGEFSAAAVHPELKDGLSKAVALGGNGKDRDVEIWESSVADGKTSWKSIWKAKNVKPTNLGLEVPIWISNIVFLPCAAPSAATTGAGGRSKYARAPATTEAYRLAVSTHHSHLRLYDTVVSRRPVFTETLSKTPILTLQLHPSTPVDADAPLTSAKESPETTCTVQNLHFVYSDKNGHFGLHATETRRSLGIYKGSTGAVLATVAEGDIVAGVGFDRYLWVYEGEEREIVSKVYVKTKGTAVVVLDSEDEKVVVEKKKQVEDPEVWDELEEVDDNLGKSDEAKGDFTEALVKIKRKKISKPPSGDKKRRIV